MTLSKNIILIKNSITHYTGVSLNLREVNSCGNVEPET